MTDTPEINTVESGDDYIHVQFRDPDQFDTIRTPDWAENVAQSVSDGATVRTGDVEGNEEWQVETVLIKNSVGEDKAKQQATEIIEKIES